LFNQFGEGIASICFERKNILLGENVRDDFSFTGVFASGAGIEEASAD
jgi:hypothetical protein